MVYNTHIPNLVGNYHHTTVVIMTVSQYKDMWKMTVGLVVTMSFPLTSQTRDRVRFLSCTTEFIDFEQTKEGEDVIGRFLQVYHVFTI